MKWKTESVLSAEHSHNSRIMQKQTNTNTNGELVKDHVKPSDNTNSKRPTSFYARISSIYIRARKTNIC